MSLSAYTRTLRDTETPRQIERRIMARITADLTQQAHRFDTTDERPERLAILASGLRDVLAENMKLWSLLKTDVLSPGNQLPPDLRAQLASLAIFVERHTAKVLAGEGKVAALLSVNRSIVAGLAGVAGEAA